MIRRLFLIALVAAVLFAGWQWLTFPDVSSLATTPPETTAFMEHRKKELRRQGKDDSLDYRWVSYDRISSNLRRAVIVSEDNAFYDHEGVDVAELRKILRESWEEKRLTRGGSTITQQLAKNLYLSPSRNPWRKVKEFLVARQMERTLTKKRILELYLNVVELGERTYGAEAAARHYFGKPAATLSASEAALLAGALPNPRKMNPGSPGPRLRSRQKIILSRMRRWGVAAEEEFVRQATPQEPVHAEPSEPAGLPEPSDPSDVVEPSDSSDPVDSSEPSEPADLPEPSEPPEPTTPPASDEEHSQSPTPS